MKIVVVEDPRVTNLYPITVGRPAFAVTVGSYRLIDHLLQLGAPIHAIVRRHLRAVVAEDFRSSLSVDDALDGPLLLVNARLVPSVETRRVLQRLLSDGQSAMIRNGDSVAAAFLPAEMPRPPVDLELGALAKYLNRLPLEQIATELPLIEYPHEVIRHHQKIMAENLEDRLRQGNYREVSDGLFTGGEVSVHPSVVVETRGGPILLEEGVSIGPFGLLAGPAYVGPQARITEHASIKDGVSLGHTTKIGGEVEATIIEPLTNKQHHGFLGHSYLGSWVNLGAGTCNSDLKNTYGKVNMHYGDVRVPTEMQFVGAIIGDYAKTAINTGIFTGKTIGVCSMVYGFVTTNVPSFVNYARLFGQVTATSPEVLVATQSRMFARRSVQQRPCDIQLLHDMFERTRHERQLGSVPLEPLSL